MHFKNLATTHHRNCWLFQQYFYRQKDTRILLVLGSNLWTASFFRSDLVFSSPWVFNLVFVHILAIRVWSLCDYLRILEAQWIQTRCEYHCNIRNYHFLTMICHIHSYYFSNIRRNSTRKWRKSKISNSNNSSTTMQRILFSSSTKKAQKRSNLLDNQVTNTYYLFFVFPSRKNKLIFNMHFVITPKQRTSISKSTKLSKILKSS